jgi:hypothetical protein
MPNRKRNFVLMTALSTSVFVAIACGGDKPEAKNPATGDNTASSSASSTAPSSTDKSSSSGSGTTGGGDPGTTTTGNLPDSGELQGAKLGSHTHSEVETKGDAGPRRPEGGGSANEPGRGAKDIQAIVASHRDEARACYDKALAAHPGIEGDLDIRWKIDPTGAVTDAEVDTTKSQILEPSVGKCIIDIIKQIKFAASPKGFESRAHYPFNFHPKPGGGQGQKK